MISDKAAAKAARQLLYNRNRIEWIYDRMAENEAILEQYAMENHWGTFPGGYYVREIGERIRVTRITNDLGFEQLDFPIYEEA